MLFIGAIPNKEQKYKTLKSNNMKTLINKFRNLDNTDKIGLIIALTFILPSFTILLLDVFSNGAMMYW